MKSIGITVLAAALAGCGGDSSPANDGGPDAGDAVSDGATTSISDAADALVFEEPGVNPGDTRADLYKPGISRIGSMGLVRATLVQALPAPPFKGDSAWTLLITDVQGSPLPGVTLSIVPRMPDHGHGTAKVPLITPGDSPGLYSANPVNLFMTGLWVNTIKITLPDGRSDTVKFSFLIGD